MSNAGVIRAGGSSRHGRAAARGRLVAWWPVAVVFCFAACGNEGAPQYQGPPADTIAAFGQCAICHTTEAGSLLAGGAALKCEVCHRELLVGRTGPGHRQIPGPEQVPAFPGPSHNAGESSVFGKCALCHNDLAITLLPLHDSLTCDTCHDDLLPGVYGSGHQSKPDEEQVPAFPGPSHNAGESSVFGKCALCHNDLAITLLPLHDSLTCDTCHDELLPGVYGPGHQSKPDEEQVPAFPGPSHNAGES
ncbi:MAG: hypothetical protein HY699_20385, partial [Deltaproteobacteria bacterium]|nr:hypothetical protein [Deltaproteobacteria bacterium]